MNSNIVNEARPCHFMNPFIRHDGAIFPCCRVWGQEQKMICLLSDPDITKKMLAYNIECSCLGYTFRPWQQTDGEFFACINIEFPMKCNARCAMCCVGAPFKQNERDSFCYDGIMTLIDRFKPRSIASQGGEVLAQPATLEFLQKIRKLHQDIRMHIVTNGSFDINKASVCGELFDSMTISIVGFQNLTYKTIMGLNLETTKKFAQFVIKETRIKVSLKYLCTPLNIHEIGYFVEWASEALPCSIQIVSAQPAQYIRLDTNIPYWQQIFKRSKASMVNSMVLKKSVFNKKEIPIAIDQDILNLFELSIEGFRKAGFETIILWH